MRHLPAVFCLLIVSTLLVAQSKMSKSDLPVPKLEFFGGYSWLHTFLPGDNPDFNGWEASGQYNWNRWLGLRADFSGHYRFVHERQFGFDVFRAQTNQYDYLFGPQL